MATCLRGGAVTSRSVTGIKPPTGTASDKTELNFGYNSVYSAQQSLAMTQAVHGEKISKAIRVLIDPRGTVSKM